ncbi:MAG: cyclic nucleotide-binding/CBS domain-containing protein [Anaerolineae bacterium]
MTLEEELRSERISHLDLSEYSQVSGNTTVRETLAAMREAGCNVCLIVDEGSLVGVFTDRDVLRKVATRPETWDQPIREFMTPNPISVRPDTSAAEALLLMDSSKFRNLPVVSESGEVCGNMTHRAIIQYLAGRYPIEVLNQPPKLDQFPRKAEGG